MTAGNKKAAGIGARCAAVVAEVEATAEPTLRNSQSRDKRAQPIPLHAAGTLFSPAGSLAWVLGLLGVGACIAPWLARGWLGLELIVAIVTLLVGYDAVALWLAQEEFAPVLLSPEKGLRGREGQNIQIPLVLGSSGRRRLPSEVRVAIMPGTEESETAIQVSGEPQWLKLERPSPADRSESPS